MWNFRLLVTVVFFLVAWVLWCIRPGVPTHWNYSRVQAGMTLTTVEGILGRAEEIAEEQVTHVNDNSFPVGHPKRLKPVVTGERYYRWILYNDVIIISLTGGVVSQKDYYTPSL